MRRRAVSAVLVAGVLLATAPPAEASAAARVTRPAEPQAFADTAACTTPTGTTTTTTTTTAAPPPPASGATQPSTPTGTTTTAAPADAPAEGTAQLPPLADACPAELDDGDDGGPGGIAGAVWGPIRRVIDSWFLALARAALKPLLELLGETMFATPDVTAPGTVRDYWAYSLVIGDTVLLLLIVIAGLVLMGHESVQTRTTIKEVAPRLLFAVVAAHASLGFSGMLIRAANALSAGFLGDIEMKSGHAATEGLIHIVLGIIAGGNIFLAILGIAVAALGIGVLCTYIARVANIVVLVGAAPLFLVAHAVPQLEGAARLWWRNLIGCLGVQVGQSLVMSAALRVFFHGDGGSLSGMPGGGTMDLLLVGSLFWLMLRIPSYAGRLIFAPRPTNAVTRQLGQGAVSQGIGAVTRSAA